MPVTKNDPIRYIARLVGVLTSVLVAAGVAILFQEQVVRNNALQQELHQSNAEIRELERMTSEVQRKKIRFQSDTEFVKRIAREMGLVCPNETVFQFVEPTR